LLRAPDDDAKARLRGAVVDALRRARKLASG
jgi:hypothetical protein